MDLKAKRDEYQGLLAQAKSITEQHQKGLPADQFARVTALMTKAGEVQGEIDQEVKLQEATKAISDGEKWLSDPVRQHPHGTNGDDDDQTKLERAGWEFKNGLAYAMTSTGKTYEMFDQRVLLGDIVTDDPAFAEYQKTTRAANSAEYSAAYCKFWRMLARSSGSETFAMQKLTGPEQKALSEGTDTAGGFTVPPDVQAELLMRTAQQSRMRGLARVQTTNRDMLRWPMLQPNASNASIYSSAFVGSWTTEVPAFSETDVAFQMFDVPIHKLRVVGKFSNDLLSDSAFNLLSTLAQDGAQNMALVEDNGFLAGTGVGNQPLGLLNGGFTTFDVEGTTTDTISNTTASAGSAPKIIAGTYLIPDQYVSGSVALMSRTIEGKIAALVDGNGRPYWPANMGSGFDLPNHRIEGLSVYNSSFMPGDGTNGNKVMFVGNVAQAYIIGQRAQITSTVLRERFADTDQTGIVIFERVGGATWNTDAGRIGIV